MKKKIIIGIGILVLVIIILSTGEEDETVTQPIQDPVGVSESITKETNSISLVESQTRSFYMGMTPWPYDFTPEAVKKTYNTINEHTDLIAHHFDDGIPWPEAFAGKNYHSNVNEELNDKVNRLKKGQKVYLAITPLNLDRTSLADYWGKGSQLEKTGEWKNKEFDDPDVIKAYTNFARDMIKRFKPTYMSYGIEVNMLAKENPSAFKKYLILTEQVYKTLKKENPNLPLFLTIQAEDFTQDEKKQVKAMKQLLPFTDYIAVSSYPYTKYKDPDDLPNDWFSKIAALAPEKSFVV
jgi:hypothetical protein